MSSRVLLPARIRRLAQMSKMAPQKLNGHLLISIPFKEPPGIVANIRSRYPELKVTFQLSTLGGNLSDSKGVSAEIWKDVTILCTLSDIPPDLNLAPKLNFVQFISAGVDHVKERELYTSSALPLCTSNGIHGPTIGEWIAMTLLVGSRKYQTFHNWHLAKSWGGGDERQQLISSVSDNVDKRFGILGYGSIGRQAARFAQVMGMDVVVHTARQRKTPESKKDHGFIVPGTGDPDGSVPSRWFFGTDKASLHEFLGFDLDYLLISLPLTKDTHEMLGKDEYAILSKRNAFVINCARGDIVRQDELIASLVEFDASRGTAGLRGYATDVTTPEPLPKNHPLWEAPNVVLTPHLCGYHKNYAARALSVLETNLERLQRGEIPLNLVDRDLGYSTKEI